MDVGRLDNSRETYREYLGRNSRLLGATIFVRRASPVRLVVGPKAGGARVYPPWAAITNGRCMT